MADESSGGHPGGGAGGGRFKGGRLERDQVATIHAPDQSRRVQCIASRLLSKLTVMSALIVL